MARTRTGHIINGWLVLDKPAGMNSAAAVYNVKRLFNARKVGHAGTLDPLATGILPLALGEATKTISFAMQSKKAYRFTIHWGVETSTDDSEGKIIQRSDFFPSYQNIALRLPQFIGAIMQIPPQFSAIKVAGDRAYNLARVGKKPHLMAREIFIEQLQIVEIPNNQEAVFEIVCGKGTYIRAIARDLGRSLGCFGHVKSLRRIRVGPFVEEDAWTLDDLECSAKNYKDSVNISKLSKSIMLPVETILKGLPRFELPSILAERIARGQCVVVSNCNNQTLNGRAYATSKGKLLAIVDFTNGELRPKRVFNSLL